MKHSSAPRLDFLFIIIKRSICLLLGDQSLKSSTQNGLKNKKSLHAQSQRKHLRLMYYPKNKKKLCIHPYKY